MEKESLKTKSRNSLLFLFAVPFGILSFYSSCSDDTPGTPPSVFLSENFVAGKPGIVVKNLITLSAIEGLKSLTILKDGMPDANYPERTYSGLTEAVDTFKYTIEAPTGDSIVEFTFKVADKKKLISIAIYKVRALAPTSLELIWSDEFTGEVNARPADHWFFFNAWGAGVWRDAVQTTTDAFLDGSGHLVMQGRIGNDNKFYTSYLQTYDWPASASAWTTFGPPAQLGKKKYIEVRVNLEQFKGFGPWCGFWLFDPSDTYDGDASNGTEIDIFEYPSWPGKDTWMNVANHWGAQGSTTGHEGEYFNTADKGINVPLTTGWHTFGLEWYRNKLIYYCDDVEVWQTSNGVSTSNGQALMLTVEYDAPPGDAWGINQDVLNNRQNFPTRFIVDYVRVYEEK